MKCGSRIRPFVYSAFEQLSFIEREEIIPRVRYNIKYQPFLHPSAIWSISHKA